MFLCIFFCWGFMLGQHFGKKPVERCENQYDEWHSITSSALDLITSTKAEKEKTAAQWNHCFEQWDTLRAQWNEHQKTCSHSTEGDHLSQTGSL